MKRFITFLILTLASATAGPSTAVAGPVEIHGAGPGGLSLVFRAPALQARPDPDQPERSILSADGMPSLGEPGFPVLPFGRTLIAVPEGTRPVLRGVTGGPGRQVDLTPSVKTVPWFGVDETGDWYPPADPELPLGHWPGSLAEIAWVGWMRDMQVAEIRFHPFRSASGRGGLLVHDEIVARVDFVPDPTARPVRRGPAPGLETGGWAAYRHLQLRAVANPDQAMAGIRFDPSGEPSEFGSLSTAGSIGPELAGATEPLKLYVDEDGLYGVSPADLTAAGISPAGLDPRDFRVEVGGVPIPVEVTGEADGVFDPNDRVIFYGKALTGRLTRENVYWLHFDGSPSRVGSRDGTFGAAAPTPASFETTVHEEMNQIYTQNIPGGAIDHWWWVLQAAGNPTTEDVTYPVSLPNVDPNAHTVSLRVNVQGRTSVSHHTQVFLNGPMVDDQTWFGVNAFEHNVSVASSSISSGVNNVRYFVVGDLSAFDQSYFNFIEITYRRTYDAVADALVAAGEAPGDFRFSFKGFSSAGILVYDVTDPAAVTAITVPPGQITGGGPFDVAFQDSLASDRLYAAATLPGLKSPARMVQEVPSNLAADPNGADWIAVTPPDPNFVAALQPLVSHRQAQGYRTLVATTEDIFDEFNFGVFDPNAIGAFLDNAWATYPGAPPEFLLLAGDTHVDYLDNFGSGDPILVPARLILISGFGETPSDNAYVTTAGGDYIPEMSSGRLPVRTAAELSDMVSKILAYETSPPVSGLNAQSLFVADNDDAAFESILNSLAGFIPPSMAQTNIFMSQLGVSGMRTALTNQLNAGALMTTYVGHGSATQWAGECPWAAGNVAPCFADDPGNLTPGGNLSFVVALNCINGYFIDLAGAGPGHVDFSLAEAMVRVPDGGAVAMWAPAALGTVSDYSSIGDWLYRDLFLNGEYVLGRAATMAAISAVTQPFSPADINNIRELTFFGDPATVFALDSDGDGLRDSEEDLAGSDPFDADSDDDGLGDLSEAQASSDPDGDGVVNALDPDSDGDGILDGTEAGITAAGPGTDLSAGHFLADADPNTTTDPFDADTDGGGAADGAEDRDFNGRLDVGETDPTAGHGGDDLTCASALPELANLEIAASGNDLVLTWDDLSGTHPCAIYRVYAAGNVAIPKDSFAPFLLLGPAGGASFTHAGAAVDGVDYDYLVVAVDPLSGAGPLGHYGQ